MQVHSLTGLEEKKNSIWRYCTEDRTSLRCKDIDRDNRHQDQAAVHPWRQKVTQANIDLICEPVKRELPGAGKDISTLMDLVGRGLLSVGTILNRKANDLEGVVEFGQMLIASKLRQCGKKGQERPPRICIEEQKYWSEIWPLGFEPKSI